MISLLPIQSVSHQKEALSRSKFDEFISPWTVLHWESVDYGIDAFVTLSQPIEGKKDREMTAKFFSVQLKSSAAKPLKNGQRRVGVGTEKINYWYGSNLPTMVAYYDENTQDFYFRWINQELIAELNNRSSIWRNQKTVTIKFSLKLKLNLKKIETYVYDWKMPVRKSLPAGLYFTIDNQIRKSISNIVKEAQHNEDLFLYFMTCELAKNLSKSIYSIAIVGESRTGKSTLINAILEREVSPVGLTKTTGAPIAIFPSHTEECEIVFQDGKKEKGKVDMSFIKKYASQSKNLRNNKKVQQINLKIANENLEKGVAIFDVPGFNDPNDKIRELTKAVLYTIDAVVYVINGGAIEYGEFILHEKVIADLKWLCREKDNVFIVINKVDRITEEETFIALKEELKSEFEHYELEKLLKQPFIYLSAKNSFEKIESGLFDEKIELLRKQIWDYLLKNNKTGIQRLLGGLNNLGDTINQAKDIHKTRISNAFERSELEKNLKLIEINNKKLKDNINNREKRIVDKIEKILGDNCNSTINNLENQMRNIPIDQPLFSSKAIEDYLRDSAFKIVNHAQEIVDNELAKVGNFAYFRVQRMLKSAVSKKEILPHKKEKRQYSLLINNHLNYSNSTGLFQAILESIGSLFSGLLEAIQALFKGQEHKRNSNISRIKSQTFQSYLNVMNVIFEEMNDYTKNYLVDMVGRSDIRIQLYSENLKKQIDQLNHPISEKEKSKLETYLSYLDGVSLKIEHQQATLKKFL